MQDDLQLTEGEIRLGREFGRSNLNRSDPARNKIDMAQMLLQLVTEGTFCKQYVIDWSDLLGFGAVTEADLVLSEADGHPDWLVAEDCFAFVEQEFAGGGPVTAAALDVGLDDAVPDPDALLVAVDVLTALGFVGLGGADKGASLIITTGEGKPTAIINVGLTAKLTLTGGNMEDLTAGRVRVVVLGRKAINLETLELTPLP